MKSLIIRMFIGHRLAQAGNRKVNRVNGLIANGTARRKSNAHQLIVKSKASKGSVDHFCSGRSSLDIADLPGQPRSSLEQLLSRRPAFAACSDLVGIRLFFC